MGLAKKKKIFFNFLYTLFKVPVWLEETYCFTGKSIEIVGLVQSGSRHPEPHVRKLLVWSA
jgi:hypothetical protein